MENKKSEPNYSINNLLYTIACTCTAMIGYQMHKSLFWAIIDFIFTPIAWIKWIICKEITLEIIKKNI